MARTGYARSIAAVETQQAPRPERPATGSAWEVLGIYRATPPTNQPWYIGALVVADVDAGVTGEIRLRSSASNVVSPSVLVTSYTDQLILGFQGVENVDQIVYLEGRRVVGSGGVRAVDAGVALMSAPPFATGPPPGTIVDPGDPGGGCVHSMVLQLTRPTIVPGPGGIERLITDQANAATEWATHRAAANPGDVIRFTESVSGWFDWRGDKVSAGGQAARSGTPGNHITVTADIGVTVTGTGGTATDEAVIDIRGVDHVDVIGLTTLSGRFGIRYQAVSGTAESPCKISHNNVGETGQAHIIVQAWFVTPWTVSSYVDVEDNEAWGIAGDTENPLTCEGVYFGRGRPRWVDRSHHLNAYRNYIHDLESDGVDIKPGVTDWEIKYNYIENILMSGVGPLGAISAWYADVEGGGANGATTPPAAITTANGRIQANRIRNVPTYWPIVVGFGGIVVYDNLCWDYNAANPAVILRSEQAFTGSGSPAQINITCNTFAGGGWDDPPANVGPARSVFSDHNMTDGTHNGEYTHSAADFVGPTTSTALAEGYTVGFTGDGSGFVLAEGSAASNVSSTCIGLMVECPGTPGHYGAMPQIAAVGVAAFSVANGIIYKADGIEYRAAGMNATTGMPDTNSWAPGALTLWNHDGAPQYRIEPDIWDGEPNERLTDSSLVFPGGGITGHTAFSASASEDATNYPGGAILAVPDRVYAMTGNMSAAAIAAGITEPQSSWNTRLARMTCILRRGTPGATQAYSAADNLVADDTVPEYVTNAQALEALGITAVPEHHAMTGTDPVLPAALVADPTLPITDAAFANDDIRDTCQFLDAMVAGLNPAQSWISLPNEPYASGHLIDAGGGGDYADFVVTLVRRVRSAGWTGIIAVPLAGYCAELGPLALGEYNPLVDRLESNGVAYNLVWDWHNYGAHVHTGAATTVYTYAEIDAQLTAVRAGVGAGNRQFAVWMGEYGQPVPNYVGTGSERANEPRIREGVTIMATDTYGEPLALKHPHICPTWWHATGDHYYAHTYSPTYGEANLGDETGPDPIPSTNTNPGRLPFWDVDGRTGPSGTMRWLTPGGRAHWDVAKGIGPGMFAGFDSENNLYDPFATLGLYTAGALGPNWSSFDSAGNASNGLRRQSAVSVVAASSLPAALQGGVQDGNVLQIAGTWDGSDITSGICQLTGFPTTYGRYQFRVAASGDPSQPGGSNPGPGQLSPVALLWPFDDDNPNKGEVDIWEGINQMADLGPMGSFLHRANPTTGVDETQPELVWDGSHGPGFYSPLGTEWHTWQLDWLPDRLTISVDNGQMEQTFAGGPGWIPHWLMKFSLQLDAWYNLALGTPVYLWCDWVNVEPALFV